MGFLRSPPFLVPRRQITPLVPQRILVTTSTVSGTPVQLSGVPLGHFQPCMFNKVPGKSKEYFNQSICHVCTSSRTKVVKSMGQKHGSKDEIIQDELLTPHAQQRRSLLLHGQRHRVLASRENRPRIRVVTAVVVVVVVVVVEVVVAAVVVVAAAVAVVAVVTRGCLGHRRVPRMQVAKIVTMIQLVYMYFE